MRRLAPLPIAFSIALAIGCDEPAAPAPDPEPEAIAVPEPPPPPPAERPGPLCSYHGWCWSSPLPQGNALHGVRAFEDEVVAVGERGTIVRRREGAWAFEDAPTRAMLRDVWGASPDGLFAVGDGGTVLRYLDGAWGAVEVDTDADLFGVEGGPGDAVYAVGAEGTALRWDGEAWSVETSFTELTLVDVRVTEGGVYALGVDLTSDRAELFERGEEGWARVEEFSADLDALAVAPTGELIVAGQEARHRAADGTLTTERLDLERPVVALWGDGGVAFAVGYDGAVTRWDGSRWREMSGAGTRDLHALDGTSAEDVWAVGADGAVLHFDGTEWSRESDGSDAHLKGVWGLAADDLWAVGENVALHFDGRAWALAGPAEHDLRGIWGAGGVLLAAGDDGALWRVEDGEWTAQHRASGEELNGVWGADVAHAFVVGKDVWLEHEDGAWVEHADRPDAAAAWGSGRDDVWVAGREGLHHWDGAAWTAVAATRDQVMFGVWGASADDVWAVGAEGRALRWDGSTWSEVETPTRQNLLGVWGSAPDDVWAVGQHGTILRWDGEAWRWRDSGTDELLHAVWGTGPDDVYVVGHGGTVLHYGGP